VDQLLSVKQAAEMLSCSQVAIRRWVSQKRLPCVKVGRLTRLRLTDLERVALEGLHPRVGKDH
jgi:excisionase family DNA binding protein